MEHLYQSGLLAHAHTQAAPTRVLKHGDTFMLIDGRGDVATTATESFGLFHHDTRHLSWLELLIDDQQPLVLGSNVRDDNSALFVDITNPDLIAADRTTLDKDTVHILRTIFLWRGTAYQRFAVRNYGSGTLKLRLALRFGADFADIFEIRGTPRARHGATTAAIRDGNRVAIKYEGLDGESRYTTLTFDPHPQVLASRSAVYELELPAGARRTLFVTIDCNRPDHAAPPFLKALIAARREIRVAAQDIASVETSNQRFNEILCRSASDLAMLMTPTPQGRFPYAGIPWYSTTFGRDGLITALQMLWWWPDVARGVLRRLAAFQAKATDPMTDAEPGKILHEMRSGEMAALGEVPFGLYFGSVDATPLFVVLAGSYLRRTADLSTIAELWPALEAALDWIDGPGDADGDGFVEYRSATNKGLVNQGWKDSHDAIFHADGRMAEGPIALAEVQGYVYAAKREAAFCARLLGRDQAAEKYETDAERLAERFDAAFWCQDIGTYALALDGKKSPCRVRTSNAGQVLFSGIASSERAGVVARQLLQPGLFSGWGIRTVAKGEARYNPMSYHNGSIWPHDNAVIALGFARYDLKPPIERLFGALFDTASYMELRRLPELFCGFERQRGHGPTLYPVACSPQAWASATPFTFLAAALGLEFDPFEGEIRLRNPRLPAFLGEVLLRNLKLGAARIDLRVRRHRDTISLETSRITGDIRVSVTHSAGGGNARIDHDDWNGIHAKNRRPASDQVQGRAFSHPALAGEPGGGCRVEQQTPGNNPESTCA